MKTSHSRKTNNTTSRTIYDLLESGPGTQAISTDQLTHWLYFQKQTESSRRFMDIMQLARSSASASSFPALFWKKSLHLRYHWRGLIVHHDKSYKLYPCSSVDVGWVISFVVCPAKCVQSRLFTKRLSGSMGSVSNAR